MPAAKASDVRFQEATFAPTANCRGILDDEREVVVSCVWSYGPGLLFSGRADVKREARKHAQLHPGHEVIVERLTRAVYWVDLPSVPELPPVNPVTGKSAVICIDANCPRCGHPERNFDTATSTFGCCNPECDYTSTERNS